MSRRNVSGRETSGTGGTAATRAEAGAMTAIEVRLRLSVIQFELRQLARHLPPSAERIVRYAANVLNLLRPSNAVEEAR